MKPATDGGFGYDALFVPEGHCKTFSQLPASVKNQFSHRARALEKVCRYLDERNLTSNIQLT
jgi:XTP/dITP diphosphohydrolase